MTYVSTVNSLYEYICKIGMAHGEQSVLILIGGCSRSGKSVVASELFEKFRMGGIDSHIVKIDSWLISFDKREPGSTVLERHDCKEIIKAVKEILKGNIVYPPVYDAISRKRISQFSKDPIYAKYGIVIAEGVIALALKELLNIAALKIFVMVPDEVRLNRLFDFYNKTKGLSIEEAKNIIYPRETEEVPFIKETAEHADVILKFGREP